MVAQALGLSTDQVRYLEKTGRIPKAERNEKSERVWTQEQVAEMVAAAGR